MGDLRGDVRLPVVAVVDADGDRLALWWVALDDAAGLSRMCGAWVLSADSEKLPSLLARRHVFITARADATDRVNALHGGARFDAQASLTCLTDELGALQAAHFAHLVMMSPTKAWDAHELRLPVLPAPLDEQAVQAAVSEEADPLQRAALGVARWMEGLGRSRDSMEAVRLSRKHLRKHAGPAPRPFPIRSSPGVSAS